MELKNQRILFFTRTMKTGGTENVILQLCEILQPHVEQIVVCSCGGINVEKLQKLGISHYDIPDIENKNPSVILQTLKTVKGIIKREKINVIHTHHRMAAFYANILKKSGITLVNTSHNTFYDKKEFTRFAYKNMHLIACGEKVKDNLVEFYGLPRNQVTVIHNAVKSFEQELAPIDEIKKLKEAGYTIVGNVGRLSEQKGMEFFIKSIPYIKQEGISAKFIIVGDGEDREKLDSLTKQLGLENDLLFLGYRSDVQNVLSQLDLVVLSSLWEGLPLTPIEAFSVGKTIVATDVDGTGEIVKNGKNGWLVQAKDEKAIADKVIDLINHKERREQFEKCAKETYQSEFCLEEFSRKILEYYSSL